MRRAFAGWILIMSAATAQATIIHVDYFGRISATFGDGFGYAIGDPVSGTFIVDTSQATFADHSGTPGIFESIGLRGSQRLVTGGELGDVTLPDGNDSFNIQNDLDGTGTNGADVFSVSNFTGLFSAGLTIQNSIGVYDIVRNFIPSLSFDQSFTILASDLVSGMMSGAIELDLIEPNYGPRAVSYAVYDLSRISVHPVSEPTTLTMLAAGLLLLTFARRRTDLA